MTKPEMTKEFRNRFQRDPDAIFFCPGRVNIIGEHIDYNGGKVMPCAISLGTYLAISKNQDNQFRFRSINFPETADLPLADAYIKTGKDWYNYPLGVINWMLQENHALSGLDLLFYGDLPVGAGLSSSASIEVLTGYALANLFGLDIARMKIALLSKEVENKFIGMNCGIMDQFAVAMGLRNKAILLDCDTLEYQYLPFQTGEYRLAIINSNKDRKLTDSKYNERFAECNRIVELLRQNLPIQNLCEVSPGQLEENKDLLGSDILLQRARHVVSENERVKAASTAMENNDLVALGELMYASHRSLQEWYEVSGKELDTIVEFSKTFDGCIGARMTGAGFGGCAIALVEKDRLAGFTEGLINFYEQRIGFAPDVFASEIGDGVRAI